MSCYGFLADAHRCGCFVSTDVAFGWSR